MLTGQLANAWATENAVAWIEKHHGPVKGQIYAVACAPYFGDYKEITARNDLTAEQLGEHLLGAAKRFSTPESKSAEAARRFHDLAKKHGIASVGYEGGSDLGQAPGRLRGPELVAYVNARTKTQWLPTTGQAVTEYLNWWFASGGREFFYYKDFSIYNKSGYWGLSNHPSNLDTPKYRAAAEAAGKHVR